MLAVAAMAAFSCAKETENQNDAVKPEVKTPLVITAYTDDDIAPDTKTSLSGVSVVWTTTDVIAGYEGVTKHTSTSTAVSDGGKKATFTFSEVSVDADLNYLVYPAAAAGAYDEGLININLPSEQTAVANSFANGANLSLAKGLVDDDAVLFKNLGGLIGIQINNDDIASVKFSANEAMTGAGVVDPSDCSTLCDGAKYVKLSGGLANGTPYYAVIYPGTYSGLQIEVTNTSGQVATYTNSTPLTIARNGNLFIAELTIPSGKWVTPTKGEEYSWNAVLADFGTAGSPKASITAGSPSMTWTTEYTWGNPATATKHLGTDASKGVQIGSASDANKCSSLVLSTSGYTQYVESIRINFSHASSGSASVSVRVGETSLKNSGNTSVNASPTPTDYTFSGGSLVKGDIVISFENSASKAFYIKSIVINPDDRTPVTLSFASSDVKKTSSNYSDFTGQTVSSEPNVSDITSNIVYSKSDPSNIISSLNTSTGALVLNGSQGTATITATFGGNATYKPASVSYTVTVSASIDYSTVYTSNVTLSTTGGASASSAKVVIDDVQYDAIKAGTGSKTGAMKLTVPSGATKLHVHMAGWSGETVQITVSPLPNIDSTNPVSLTADSGVSGSSTTYTLSGSASSYYFAIDLKSITTDTELTFSATSGKRFVIWGVNAE